MIQNDRVWRFKVYRLALFIGDLAWADSTRLFRTLLTRRISGQLFEAASSIAPHISEGFSRGTGKGRAIFYEYALGSARESRDWYYQARHLLGEQVTTHRMELCSQVIKLLLAMLPGERLNSRKR